jgi:hypothetical protein
MGSPRPSSPRPWVSRQGGYRRSSAARLPPSTPSLAPSRHSADALTWSPASATTPSPCHHRSGMTVLPLRLANPAARPKSWSDAQSGICSCRGDIGERFKSPLRHEPVACSSTTVVSVLVSIHLRPAPFTDGHQGRVRARRGRWRTPVNTGQHCWKACWGQPLRSSNLLSSATSDQAIHKPRSCVWPGLARLRSLICSLIHYTYIGIKCPKDAGARF